MLRSSDRSTALNVLKQTTESKKTTTCYASIFSVHIAVNFSYDQSSGAARRTLVISMHIKGMQQLF
ncbi:hypothetical protein Nizo1839_2600 [Lactiplantibacillus plantarum]|nr:hypothetical protein FD10_GL002759 [Lactiplantibacillus argentoratensis DSM 16365]KTF00950.1 hypothetical protein SF2A35B_2419 [Lactiplantibacillus plantarum]KZT78538.1 hypothetical protein Nizo1839_2600 [Lactiplantibacillus plantarum]